VDNSQDAFTCLEWCAGYAGFHLGLRRVIPNLRCLTFSEIEAYACANLVAKMEAGLLDPAPVWTNLKTFPCDTFRDRVDLLVAGYPCQPFSAAGLRQGASDPRHLWPFILDGLRRIQPRLCFFENVEGHISLGLSTVLSDLETAGYRATWGIFSAAEIGASHQRKRVFILAQLADQHDPRGLQSQGSQPDQWRRLGVRCKELADAAQQLHDRGRDTGARRGLELANGGWRLVVFAAECAALDADREQLICAGCGGDYAE
jgi:site-specific DNA-cytosine methylase